MMATNVKIRPAVQADAPSIARLFHISSDGVADYVWDGHKDEYPGLDGLEIGAKRYARKDKAYSYQNCLMADVGGEVAAMVHSFPMKVSDVPLRDDFDPVMRPYAELKENGSLYISGIAVFDGFRNQGIGSKVLSVLENRAQILGCSSLSLIVFEQNEGAVRLYERLGFKETARRAVVPHPLIHYTGDALLMVRSLND